MYKNCMFCHKPLGANAVIETFPVGRRLAFDAERGRLWVVCAKCERWNLSPLEERWEAVEDCERIFRETRLRVSTENIGLARHPEGLTLVRVGRPLRSEFAAWRYGDQFGRRRRRSLVYGAAAIVAGGAVVAGGLAAGVISGVMVGQGYNLVNAILEIRGRARLRTDDGEVIKMNRSQVHDVRLARSDDGDGFRVRVSRKRRRKTWHEGDEARRFASILLPKLNSMGGRRETVNSAVQEIEASGHPERFLIDAAARSEASADRKGDPRPMIKMPAPTRLALEMALHEERERRALEGELWLLELAWREAEEIADISDKLLLPEGAEEFVEKHRR